MEEKERSLEKQKEGKGKNGSESAFVDLHLHSRASAENTRLNRTQSLRLSVWWEKSLHRNDYEKLC